MGYIQLGGWFNICLSIAIVAMLTILYLYSISSSLYDYCKSIKCGMGFKMLFLLIFDVCYIIAIARELGDSFEIIYAIAYIIRLVLSFKYFFRENKGMLLCVVYNFLMAAIYLRIFQLIELGGLVSELR